MARTIISQAESQGPAVGGGPPAQQADTYTDRLVKYIPSEIITLYVTLEGVVRARFSGVQPEAYSGWLWGIFVIGLVATPLYLVRVAKVSKTSQLLLSSLAYVIWVIAVGTPFKTIAGWDSLWGALLLPIFTFGVPLFVPEK